MQLPKSNFLLLTVCLFFASCFVKQENKTVHRQVWTQQEANAWYGEQKWLVGANFMPSTAINQLEMWQAETFDTVTINRELGLAESIGMNTQRVFLHDLLYEQDSLGLYKRMDIFLHIAKRHHI
ncbi:MAG: 1,4-beta-xylanase, partial [Daejeonella sp.]|nr:1,4-beta-xylanase [Daejeonella sp.]